MRSHRRNVLAAMLVVMLVVGAWPPASAAAGWQENPYGRIALRGYDRALFLLLGDQKRLIWPVPLAVDALDAIPEGDPVADRSLGDLGWAPNPAGDAGWLDSRLALRHADTAVFLINGGQKHLVSPVQLADADIDAIPEGVPLADAPLLPFDPNRTAIAAAAAGPPPPPPPPPGAVAPPPPPPVAGTGQLRVSGSISGWRQSGSTWNVNVYVMVLRDNQPVQGAQTSVDFGGDVRPLPETGANGASNALLTVDTGDRPSINGVITACLGGECGSASQVISVR